MRHWKHSVVAVAARSLCSAIFLLVFAETYAQGFHGRILVGDTVPLTYATVYIPALRRGVMTDPEGRYAVSSLPAGSYAVEFSSLGYRTVCDTIAVADGAEVERDVCMEELAYTLREVIVTDGDENAALAVVRKMRDNAQRYYGQLTSYEAEIVTHYEQHLNKVPAFIRRAAKSIAFMMGARRFVNMVFKYPDLHFTTSHTATYDGTLYNTAHGRVIECSETLTAKEEKWVIRLGCSRDNVVEQVNYPLLPWVGKNEKKHHFAWEGSYEENGHIINVVRITPVDTTGIPEVTCLHIIEDLWCVLKWDTTSADRRESCECKEILPGLFLPISYLDKRRIDLRKDSTIVADATVQGGHSIQYKSIATR